MGMGSDRAPAVLPILVCSNAPCFRPCPSSTWVQAPGQGSRTIGCVGARGNAPALPRHLV